ncbi:hypothetical protein BGZ99_005225 [Dissophora globulifera]|uniref:Ion transport domain-containing protein n=1 Tax=Dissophora globulifera TaxID=979702 RepID=A0A9P6RI58_9FUNG|nr:hypothetical protein BGZ99_005225 [Dissophora globulifera]
MGSSNSRDSAERQNLFSPQPQYGSEERSPPARYHDYGYGGAPRPFPTSPVTALVKEARYAIINALDTSLTRDELSSPEIYLALILPIVRKYREERKETAAVYCFLLNRAHACEIVATKVLKAFTLRQLIDVLTYDFSPVRRKDERFRLYLPHFEGEPSTEPMSALEVAISGKAKHFISNPLVQEIVNQIWLGEIVFFSDAIDNPRSCLHASQQEIRTVTVYDSRDIKFLRLSRLRVPRYKTTFQMVSFTVFISVYTYVTFAKEARLTAIEVIMDLFALSFTLDEFTELKDSGFSFYFETVWNLFDVPIYIIFLVFMSLRISTFFTGSIEMSDFAYDFLACNAILLWPRLFAALDHYRFFGTMLIVLRQMLLDAMLFLALSFIFFLGFLQAFYALHDNTKSYSEIAWLLLQVFFGSAFLGFEQASELSEQFGAPLMVLFVAISVLMLYTLLISIFSQTFSEVSANAKEEFMFLFSVKVMEEVKSDALYEFQPPFNILAGILIWPCSLIYPPETVGKLSRVLLRILYFPELVGIWFFESVVLRKKPQFLPIRPGLVDHHGAYFTMPPNSSSGSTTQSTMVGGGVAKRRKEASIKNAARGTMKASAFETTREDALSPSESEGLADPFQSAAGQGPSAALETATASQPNLDPLDTRGLHATTTHTEDILSPYIDSIRLFKDGAASRPSTEATMHLQQADEDDQNQIDSPYSYYPSAPIGMGGGYGMQGSMPLYQSRMRLGTEAMLANTFQGGYASYIYNHGGAVQGGEGGGDGFDSIRGNQPVNGPYYPYQPPDHQYRQYRSHQQQQQQHQYQQRQHRQQHQREQDEEQEQWHMDDVHRQDDELQERQERQELARLAESRYLETRIRMEQIESKLDRLIEALARSNGSPASQQSSE